MSDSQQTAQNACVILAALMRRYGNDPTNMIPEAVRIARAVQATCSLSSQHVAEWPAQLKTAEEMAAAHTAMLGSYAVPNEQYDVVEVADADAPGGIRRYHVLRGSKPEVTSDKPKREPYTWPDAPTRRAVRTDSFTKLMNGGAAAAPVDESGMYHRHREPVTAAEQLAAQFAKDD